METPINRFSPIEVKEDLKSVLYEQIQDVLWNKIFYLASFATTSVNSTGAEVLTAKEVDTSAGLYLSPRQKTRFKTTFYLFAGWTNSLVYITAPAVSTVSTAITAILNSNTSFVGIKIDKGTVYLVAKNREKANEVLTDTGKKILDATTHLLEIVYSPNESTDFYLDNEYIGSVKSNLTNDDTFATFFPYLTSVASYSGTVNMTIEGYEFIQERQ